ncbi:5-guanidino-2-oxopentanoate decarboxylase [Yoonia sp. GPGPB17]
MLKDRGVDVIFGIPGVHNQEMYRGIEEAAITHVLARHEQGAGFMADGYARATGKPGVAYVISGPGLCNIMTPMGQAYSDSVPMLVISSVLDETEATRGQLHQMKDQEGAAAAVCDWSVTARTAEASYQLIDRALSEFQRERPKPKHIQVPISLLESRTTLSQSSRKSVVDPCLPAGFWIEDLELIKQANRPLVIVGGGCVSVNRTAEMFVEALGAASFSTYAGRGIIRDGSPLHFGAFLARASSKEIFAEADLIILLGTQLSEVDLWRNDLGHDCKAIHVDIDTAELVRGGAADLRIKVSAEPWMEELLVELGVDYKPATGWSIDAVSKARQRWRAEIDAERPGILPVADALKDAVPDDTMFYSDMTQFAYAAKEVYPMDRPGHWHHPYGFGTLGYALPAAIGGKIGVGDQPVIAILGDYGFQYTVQELAVAVEMELTLPIIIWDNGKLGEIEDSMVRAQIAPNAVVQRNPDFLKLAAAYGAESAEPTDLAQFKSVLQAALQAKGPTVIRVKSDIALTSN